MVVIVYIEKDEIMTKRKCTRAMKPSFTLRHVFLVGITTSIIAGFLVHFLTKKKEGV